MNLVRPGRFETSFTGQRCRGAGSRAARWVAAWLAVFAVGGGMARADEPATTDDKAITATIDERMAKLEWVELPEQVLSSFKIAESRSFYIAALIGLPFRIQGNEVFSGIGSAVSPFYTRLGTYEDPAHWFYANDSTLLFSSRLVRSFNNSIEGLRILRSAQGKQGLTLIRLNSPQPVVDDMKSHGFQFRGISYLLTRDIGPERLLPFDLFLFEGESKVDLEARIRTFLEGYYSEFVMSARAQFNMEIKRLNAAKEANNARVLGLKLKLEHVREGIGETTPLDADVLNQARGKQLLLNVEIAGLNARVAAINDHRKNAPADTLVDLLTTTEIDLVTLLAQKKVVDELVAKQSLFAERNVLVSEIRKRTSQIVSELNGEIAFLDLAMTKLVPLEIVGNLVSFTQVKLIPATEP